MVGIDAQFEGNSKDLEIYHRLYTRILKDKIDNMTVGLLYKSAIELAAAVDGRVRGVDTAYIKFEKGTDGVDTAALKFAIQKNNHSFMSPFFGYYQNPGQINLGYHFKKFTKTFGGLLKPF